MRCDSDVLNQPMEIQCSIWMLRYFWAATCDMYLVHPGASSGVRIVLFASGESREPVLSVEIVRRSWENAEANSSCNIFMGC